MALFSRLNMVFAITLMVLTSGCADSVRESATKSTSVSNVKSKHVTTRKRVTARKVTRSRLAGVKTWAFQLQKINPRKIANSSVDLVVVDYSKDGTQRRAFRAADIRRMRKKPNGKKRVVLAYLSIGEAESYRYYWRNHWNQKKPAWLGPENPNWPKNYKVRYWHKDWQRIIFGHRKAYLDKIIAAGFDGIYLDIIDAYEFWGNKRPGAADDMVKFVSQLASYSRARKKGFLIVPQNGEGLLRKPKFTASIDAFAKEDLLFGVRGVGVPNSNEETAYSLRLLNLAKRAGKPIFVTEYISGTTQVTRAKQKLASMGFLPYISRVQLDRLASR